jgi:hypothetical protein
VVPAATERDSHAELPQFDLGELAKSLVTRPNSTKPRLEPRDDALVC